MIRVKLPFGGVTPEQMEAFADLAELYTPLKKGHITTRQNFQFHHIPLSDAAKAIRMIGEVGLSSREACGNTVRNVTGDPWAGVCEGELFDPTPYVGAFVRYFVRNEVCQLLPRKFKVAFTATDEDRAITNIHDLGFVPADPRGGRQAGEGIRDPHRRRHVDHAPRGRPLLGVRDGRRRRVPEGLRGRPADLRPPGLPARQPRAGPDQVPDRQGRDRGVPHDGRRGAEGRLGQRARLHPDALLFVDDEQANAPAKPLEHRQPQRRQPRVQPLCRLQRHATAPGRVLHRRGEGHPR